MNTRGTFFRVAVCSLLTAHCPLFGQPAFFEPKEHFYKAKGQGVRVNWRVEPTTVSVGSDLTATLVITGAQNPTEIVKPDLRRLKPFDVFIVADVREAPRDAKAKEVRFAYKLSPRSTAVKEVPALKFHYFNPAAAPGKTQFPSTVADAIPFDVREAPKAARTVVPIDAPEFLFQIATGPEVLGSGPFVPCRLAWLAAVCFGPLAAYGWFLAWRRVFPDAARLARLRRSRAVRRATDAIHKSQRAADPPAAIASAVLGYLRARYPLPESAVTPSDIAASLKELKVSDEHAEQTADVFRGCDRARFGSTSDSGVSLAATAEAAIARLEALE